MALEYIRSEKNVKTHVPFGTININRLKCRCQDNHSSSLIQVHILSVLVVTSSVCCTSQRVLVGIFQYIGSISYKIAHPRPKRAPSEEVTCPRLHDTSPQLSEGLHLVPLLCGQRHADCNSNEFERVGIK